MSSVLIVENDYYIARYLSLVIERAGHQVVGMAASFERALEIAATTRPELALVDFRLDGERDGVTTARALRETFGVKIVYVTADPDQVQLIDGMSVIVRKPFTDEELERAVATVLASAENEPPARPGEISRG